MTRFSVTCEGWKALQRNTLQGFAAITVAELDLKIYDVAVHAKGDRRWAQLPARPWIKNGSLVTGDDGKVQYSPVLEFARRETADAFSRAVIDAILRVDPHALAPGGAVSTICWHELGSGQAARRASREMRAAVAEDRNSVIAWSRCHD